MHCKKTLISLFFLAVPFQKGLASDWGLSVGYNNPAGAKYGLNLAYLGQRYAFEFGVGSAQADKYDNSSDASLQGDIDIKALFASSGLTPYVEAGVAVGIGGKVGSGAGLSVGAGNPFAGVGLLYKWNTPFIYLAADYGFSTNRVYGAGGLGLLF